MEYKKQRLDILKELYAAREKAPRQGWITMYELKKLSGECLFAIEYLTEREHIKADGNQYRITASGMDVVEDSEIR